MSHCRKAKQVESYSGTQYSPPPCLSSEYSMPEETRIKAGAKRKAKDMPQQEFLNYFQQAMQQVLKRLVNSQLAKANSSDQKLQEMKKKLLETKAVPRNLYSTTDELAGLQIKETYRRFMEDMQIKSGTLLWKEFVTNNFEKITANIKSKTSTSLPSFSSSTLITSAAIAKENYAVCTVSLNSIVRQDIPENVKEIFYRTIDETLTYASNFISDFQVLVYSTMLSFRDNTFEVDGDTLSFVKKQGFETKTAFPSGFHMEADIPFTASPFSEDFLNSNAADDIKNLFSGQHVSFLKSSFFGAQGTYTSSRLNHPVQSCLVEAIPQSTTAMFQNKQALPMSVIEVSLTNYITNLEVMWREKKIINRLLNKLIETLLKIHLAPIREKKYRSYVDQKKKSLLNKEQINESPKKSRNFYRMKKREEEYKLKKLYSRQEKGDHRLLNLDRKIQNCKERIEKHIMDMKKKQASRAIADKDRSSSDEASHNEDTATLEENDILEDIDYLDAVEEFSPDASRRRIFELKGFLKTRLFQQDEENVIQTINCTDQEEKVCNLIYEIISPYIPNKKNYALVGFQMPFVIFANDLLRCAGYSKFTSNICPLPSAGLSALSLNAQCIYDLFCFSKRGNANQVHIFDFDTMPILDRKMAVNYKDPIFNSFFDLLNITKACTRKKLKSDHNITILPGCQYVRILGTKKNQPMPTTKDLDSNSNIRSKQDLPWDDISRERLKSDQVLKIEIDELQEEVKELSDKLKTQYVELKEYNFTESIQKEKSNWNKSTSSKRLSSEEKNQNKITYNSIQKQKLLRSKTYEDIGLTKKKLSKSKQELYIRRKALTVKSTRTNMPISATYSHKEIDSKKASITKVENARIVNDDIQDIAKNFVFSGTDNGIVKMTESIPLSIQRFKYHLNLYNRFKVLSNKEDHVEIFFEDLEYIPLPKTFTTNSADIDLGAGFFKQRKRMESRKRKAPEVLAVETMLADKSLRNTVSRTELESCYQAHVEGREVLRSFYDSKKECKRKMKVEHLNKKFRERLCSSERRYLLKEEEEQYATTASKKKNKKSKKHLVMFIGDRGTGVGSRIKGHRRYGGLWKQDIHAKNTSVCITNEHKTSQTCVYCFNQLYHPKKKVITKKGKTMYKDINGAFICYNLNCPSSRVNRNICTRDSVSAMAIALSGLANLLFNATFPQFNPKVSQTNTEFNKKTTAFLNRSADEAGCGAS